MRPVLFTDVVVLDASGAEPFPGEVLVQGNRYPTVAVAASQIGRDQAAEVIDGQGMTLMPGMVEGHCHPSFTGVAMPYQLGMIPPEEHTLKTAANAKLLLDSGFTSIYSPPRPSPGSTWWCATRSMPASCRARGCAPPAPRSGRDRRASATSASCISTARASR